MGDKWLRRTRNPIRPTRVLDRHKAFLRECHQRKIHVCTNIFIFILKKNHILIPTALPGVANPISYTLTQGLGRLLHSSLTDRVRQSGHFPHSQTLDLPPVGTPCLAQADGAAAVEPCLQIMNQYK